MPKEQVRKRGRRVRKGDVQNEAEDVPVQPTTEINEPVPSTSTSTSSTTPGGIHPSRAAFLAGRSAPRAQVQDQPSTAPEAQDPEEGPAEWHRGPRVDSEFPFGVLDPDVKAYFRNVEEQIKDWEGVSSAGEEREDRQLFLTSVLSELRSHELPTSTDPETSIVLERLLPSLNDWGRRVIGDSVGDKWEELIRHRFGSHVVQTWLTLAAGTLDREARGIWPPQQSKQETNPAEGQLPKMTELFLNIIKSLSTSFADLLSSPHASPPLRLLLLILTPNRAVPALESNEGDKNGLIRSKRSNKFRKNQDVKGKSILGDNGESAKGKGKRQVPAELVAKRKEITDSLKSRLGEAEWKAMGVDTVGSATVQLLLEFEVEDGAAEKEGSLFDILTEGLVTQLNKDPKSAPEPQPYLSTVLQTQTGTRLFETLLSLAPDKVFKALWKAYFVGKLGKLAGHPYANFVTAKGVSRLDKKGIEALIGEVEGNSGGRGLIKAARTSVLQALVERSVILGECQQDVLKMYQAILSGSDAPQETEDPSEEVDKEAEDTAAAYARRSAWENRRTAKPKAGEGEVLPNMQGCLILQGMMGMKDVNGVVLDSLTAQRVNTLLTYAKSPISSHFLDKVFTDPAVQPKYCRKVMLLLMDSWKELVEDRIGSRVMDTVWDKADGYMKEKIARSLIPHIVVLGQSQYAKYFLKKAELSLLQRRPDEWREKVVGLKHHFAHQKKSASIPVGNNLNGDSQEGEGGKKRKNESGSGTKDEIDMLFEGVEKKKSKKRKD
uniref:Nucleolar protein 9 n=1 Tax=Kwoniella dejecticola CBS 10117 TaxID=1296121 RepID=A0A1A6AH44_9TREE|nr:uncharacterized protein I303_01219 [Kwoniella dejecticola CBS 10117]OBR89392.1 hypothetical protein I303_01219 [Kwoniella dejecticola CBS 10117]